MLTNFLGVSLLLVSYLTSQVQAYRIDHQSLERRDKPACSNKMYDFTKSKSLNGWIPVSSSTENYALTPQGVEMRLLKPKEVRRVITKDENKPVNSEVASGFTFNHTTTMMYGKVSIVLQSAPAPGAITAAILYADNGDEIDFEFLSGPRNQVTTNYFYGHNIVYGVNGRETDVPSGNAFDHFYTYTIEWTPEKIEWSINNQKIRTLLKSQTVLDPKRGNVHQYPYAPSRVSIGLWDGSKEAGTAEWAKGPIDWNKYPKGVSAYVKSVEITCNPQYNTVV